MRGCSSREQAPLECGCKTGAAVAARERKRQVERLRQGPERRQAFPEGGQEEGRKGVGVIVGAMGSH